MYIILNSSPPPSPGSLTQLIPLFHLDYQFQEFEVILHVLNQELELVFTVFSNSVVDVYLLFVPLYQSLLL